MKNDKVLFASIVGSMLLWGLSWPSGKVLTHYCSAVNFAVYRYIIVAATLLPILLVLKVNFRVSRRGIPYLLLAGLLLAIYTWFFFMGLKTGAAGAGGVLSTTLSPVIAFGLGMVLNRKWPTKNEAAGLLLGLLAGTVLLKLWNNSGNIFAFGNVYFLMAATTWAILGKCTSMAGRSGSPMAFSFWQYVVTMLCLFPMANFTEMEQVFQIRDPFFWGNLFFSSVVVTSLATTLFFYSTTRLGAEKASSFIFMVPLAAALSSWFILGEVIQTHSIIGGLLGIMAVYLINKRKKVARA